MKFIGVNNIKQPDKVVILAAVFLTATCLLSAVCVSIASADSDTPSLTKGEVYTYTANPFYPTYAGQCTAYAWGRTYEKLGIQMKADKYPDANLWLTNGWKNKATDQKFAIGAKGQPKSNSIAVWGWILDGKEVGGHVAFVENVNGNTVTFTESNWNTYKKTNRGGGYDGDVKSYPLSNFETRAAKEGTYILKGYIYLTNPQSTLPNLPTSLIQYKSDGVTGITLGGTTSENTVVMRSVVSDPKGINVQLEVEVKPISEKDFTGTPTFTSVFVASNGIASVPVKGLSAGQYHWRARTKNLNGVSGPWLSAGGNAEEQPDFVVSTAQTPQVTSKTSTQKTVGILDYIKNRVQSFFTYITSIPAAKAANTELENTSISDGTKSNGNEQTINGQQTITKPEITSIYPYQKAADTFDLTIYGNNFDSGPVDQIYWKEDGHLVGQGTIKRVSGSQIIVTEYMKGATPGTYIVRVMNSDGTVSNGKELTINGPQSTLTPQINSTPVITSAPMVTSIYPYQKTAGTFDLTIYGNNFDSGAVDRIYWKEDGHFVGQGTVKSVSGSKIVVTEFMEGATPGAYNIKVMNSNGTESNGQELTINDPESTLTPVPTPVPTPDSISTPEITSIYPYQKTAGTFDLTIYGNNFDSGAVDRIYWKEDGHFVGQGTVKSVSGSKIVVTEFMEGATPGAYNIKVMNSDGTESNGQELTINDPESTLTPVPTPVPTPDSTSTPEITSIYPYQKTAGTFDLTIYGNNFDSGAVDRIYWKEDGHFVGQGTVKSVSGSKIVVTEFMEGATPGAYNIKVMNSDGTESNGQELTINDPESTLTPVPTPVPTPDSTSTPEITLIYPYQKAAGTFDLTIYGNNFDSGAVDRIYWKEDGHFVGQGTVKSISGSKIVVTEFMEGATPGAYNIKVMNSDGTESNGQELTINDPESTLTPVPTPVPTPDSTSTPEITLIYPYQKAAGTFDLTIYGNNFDSGAVDRIYWKEDGHFVGQGTVKSISGSKIVVTEFMEGATPGIYIVKVMNSDGTESNGEEMIIK